MRWMLSIVCLAVVVCPALAWAQDGSEGQADEPSYGELERAANKRIVPVLDRLIEEANQLRAVEEADPEPVFRRPHPLVARLTIQDVPFVLRRMVQLDRIDNDYEKTYVRWHLLEVVNRGMEAHAAESLASGELTELSEVGPLMIKLFRDMPGNVGAQKMQSVRYEPEDVYKQAQRLGGEIRGLTSVTIGYPPFTKTYTGKAAFPHISEGKKKRALEMMERLEQLRSQYKTIHNPFAIAYNKRIDAMNSIIRHYRGDLTYNIVLTGDPAMLKMIIERSGELAENWDRRAFDLIKYVYRAAFLGYLPLYRLADKGLLMEAAAALRTAARRMPGFMEVGGRYRSYQDYVFHLTFMLEDLDNVPEPRTVARPPAPPAEVNHTYTPGTLTIEQIENARLRAIEALYRIKPNIDRLITERQARLAIGGGNYRSWQHEMGNHAAALWALVAAKESYQNPDLLRRLHWVLSQDAPFTYDRGLRTILLSNLPSDRWRAHLRRDAVWLEDAMTGAGAFPYVNRSGDTSRVDMANSQYGVLGLWALQESGFPVSTDGWERVDDFWSRAFRKTGNNIGGWSILPATRRAGGNADERAAGVNGPMTAGGVSTLMLTDRYLRGRDMVEVGQDLRSKQMVMGLNWLDNNFKTDLRGTADENDFYLYMWTMQRVGRASGYRTFNNVDWFRDVTAKVLNDQAPDGTWDGPKGELLSTAFALLYLGNSYDPLAIGKIRVPNGAWNDRPHDLWNFSDWVSDEYEVSTGWQIFELETRVGGRKAPQHTYQLIEAPIQYFTTSDYVTFNDNQIQALRNYINAGGLLVTNTSGGGDAARTIRELSEKLFPNQELADVPNDHPFYGVHREVGLGLPLKMIGNHIRPLWLHSQRDLSRPLQAFDTRSDAFGLLSNIYLYSIGMNPRRTRLGTDHVVKRESVNPRHTFSVARVRHDGRYDPEPAALEQLGAFMHNEHEVELKIAEAEPTKLSKQDMAFLTLTGGDTLSEAQAKALSDYVQGGGTLWIDAAGGDDKASTAAFEAMSQIMPGKIATRLLADSPVISGLHDGRQFGYDMGRVRFRPYALRSMGPVNSPRLQAIEIDGRPAVIFSAEDVTCALAGLKHWGIFGYLPDSARKLAANSILHKLHHGGDVIAAR